MDISEIRDRYNSGYYTYRVNIPTKVPADHVFDEELSVRRNRELVAEHNDKVEAMKREERQKQQELYSQLTNDVVAYIMEAYGLSLRQAREVESFTYQEKHAFMCDYFSFIDTFADFAESILHCEEPDIL